MHADSRLVHQQEIGMMYQGDHHIDAPLHAAGEGLDGFIAVLVKSDKAQKLFGSFFAFFSRKPVDLTKELQVLHRVQVFIQRDFLRHDADNTFHLHWLFGHRYAVDNGVARGRFEVAAHHIDGDAFARAVRAKQAKDFTLADSEGDAFDRLVFAKGFDQVGDLDIHGSAILRQVDRTGFREVEYRILHDSYSLIVYFLEQSRLRRSMWRRT